MSAETFANLQAALATHLQDEYDSPLGGWVLSAETTTIDEYQNDSTSATYLTREGQSLYTTIGLLTVMLDAQRNVGPHRRYDID